MPVPLLRNTGRAGCGRTTRGIVQSVSTGHGRTGLTGQVGTSQNTTVHAFPHMESAHKTVTTGPITCVACKADLLLTAAATSDDGQQADADDAPSCASKDRDYEKDDDSGAAAYRFNFKPSVGSWLHVRVLPLHSPKATGDDLTLLKVKFTNLHY